MSKVILHLCCFCDDWLAKFAPFSQPARSNTKTNKILCLARMHFPMLDASYVYVASNSNWLIVLFTSVVIDYFGLGVTTLIENLSTTNQLKTDLKQYLFSHKLLGLLRNWPTTGPPNPSNSEYSISDRR